MTNTPSSTPSSVEASGTSDTTEDLTLLHIANDLPLALVASLMSMVAAATSVPGVDTFIGAGSGVKPMPCLLRHRAATTGTVIDTVSARLNLITTLAGVIDGDAGAVEAMASRLSAGGQDARNLARVALVALDPALLGDAAAQVSDEDAHAIARDAVRANLQRDTRGGLAVTLNSSELSLLLIDSVRECLTADAGENFVEYTLHDDATGGRFTVVLLRPTGLSPAELLAQEKTENDRLRSLCRDAGVNPDPR